MTLQFFFSEIVNDLLAKSWLIEIYFLKQDIAIILKKNILAIRMGFVQTCGNDRVSLYELR